MLPVQLPAPSTDDSDVVAGLQHTLQCVRVPTTHFHIRTLDTMEPHKAATQAVLFCYR